MYYSESSLHYLSKYPRHDMLGIITILQMRILAVDEATHLLKISGMMYRRFGFLSTESVWL